MRNLCLYFQVHQPFRLRNYSFFEIGENSDYFDEEANRGILEKVARKCYLPANELLLELIRKHGENFKVSFSVSGTALDQFERYMPELIESFRALASTGHVEFMAETYGHSLAVLKSREEFVRQVKAHAQKTESLLGYKPRAFRNTELVYADFIGDIVHDLGFSVMLAEGADRILHWKSPNYLYSGKDNPGLKLLLKNFRLSDDIAFRFSDRNWREWPLTADKFVHWLNAVPESEQVVNLFMDYETFGEHQWAETGIFDFLKALPGKVLASSDYHFITPSQAAALGPVGTVSMPQPVSWADQERDLSAWLGNDMQNDAFDTLYALEEQVRLCNDARLIQDWLYLQASDHFYYMCTKYFADGDVHKYFNHYDTPFDAFINYMNVLTDFSMRVQKLMDSKKTGIFPFTSPVLN